MKQKTHSGVKKRVKKTGTGKIKMRKSAVQHRLTSKSKGQKKLGKIDKSISKGDAKNLAKLLPN